MGEIDLAPESRRSPKPRIWLRLLWSKCLTANSRPSTDVEGFQRYVCNRQVADLPVSMAAGSTRPDPTRPDAATKNSPKRSLLRRVLANPRNRLQESISYSGLSENFTPLRRNGPVSRLNFRNYLFFNAQKFMARLMLKFWRVKNQCT